MYIEGIDKIDNKILEVIKDDARLTYSEIGGKVGLSRVSVKNRMAAMEKSGVIRGYQTVLDPTNAETGTRFFMDIEVKPDFFEEYVEFLSSNKMIRQIYSVTGSGRIHAVGYASVMKELERFARQVRTSSRGVTRLELHTVLSTMYDIDGGVEYERPEESEHLEGTEDKQNS